MKNISYWRRFNYKQFLSKPIFVFVAASILGATFFVFFYGTYVVNPTHVDWLMSSGGDLKQHYLGWVFYRSGIWTFPIGTISGLAYPYGLPVTYVDSIPLLAILFKAISSLLPMQFQYFGMWGLLCYMLQGGFTALIIRHWTKNTALIMLSSVIFIASPVLMLRMFNQTALASQWIILAGLWLLVEWRYWGSLKRYTLLWSILFFIAILVHPYFIPMISIFLIISIVLAHKNWWPSIVKLLIPILVTVLVFWVIGGFAVGSTSTGGLGLYSLNLDSLINSFGWSKFLPGLSSNLQNSEESLNYLGFGIILLLPVVVFLVSSYFGTFKKICSALKEVRPKQWLIVLVLFGACVFSLGPQIHLGSKILLELHPSNFIEGIWSIFRATGRIFWPIYYGIMAATLVGFIHFAKRKMSSIMLVVFLAMIVCIQLTDIGLSAQSHAKHTYFLSLSRNNYKLAYNPTPWTKYATGKKNMIILDSSMVSIGTDTLLQDSLNLSALAARYNLTMNTGYYARAPWDKILTYQNNQKKLLLQDSSDLGRENIFITRDESFVKTLSTHDRYEIGQLNGFYIIKLK
jgi:hypothetical protein